MQGVRGRGVPGKRRGTTPWPGGQGFSTVELAVGVLVVFTLLLGLLILVTSERGDSQKEYGVSPYRAMYAGYINSRLKEWTNAILSYREMQGSLPGDSPVPRTVNSRGEPIGNNNGRVERELEENRKFFSDLFGAGLASEPLIRLRGRIIDFYWADLSRNGTRGAPGNYFVLPGINHDEAVALDHNYDDADRAAGSVVYFDNPDGTVDLFVRFSPF